MNMDSHLNPVRRHRSPEEVHEILIDAYEAFLRDKVAIGEVWSLLAKLNEKNQKEAIDTLIEFVTSQDPAGRRDAEFRKTLDRHDLEWEES